MKVLVVGGGQALAVVARLFQGRTLLGDAVFRRQRGPTALYQFPIVLSTLDCHSSHLWNDSRLDVVGAILQAAQDGFQLRQLCSAGDVFAALETPAGKQVEGPAASGGRVVKARLERDVVVVQPISIDLDLGAGGAAPEEVYRAPAAN